MSKYNFVFSTNSINIIWEEYNDEDEYILVRRKRKPNIFKDKFYDLIIIDNPYETQGGCIMEELAKNGHTGAIWVVCTCPRCTPRC